MRSDVWDDLEKALNDLDFPPEKEQIVAARRGLTPPFVAGLAPLTDR